MRLIDADNVLKALGIFNDREHGDPHFLNGIETAREIVEQAPSVDAAPIEPLCDFLARNYEPLYDLDDVHDLKWPIDKDQQKAAWMKVLKRIQNDNSKGVSLE